MLKPTGVMLPLPSRRLLWLVQGLLLALSVALALASKRAGRAARALAVVAAALSAVLLLLATPFTRPWVHGVSAMLTLATVVALVLSLITAPGGRASWGRRTLENAAITGLAISAVLLLGETIATGLPASHAVGYTLASRLWYARHWKLSNRQGFRDAERDAEPGRRVYVLGDSFVAGVGIADVDERFSNLLHRRLAPEFKVYNLGRNGSATRDEYRVLLEQPEPPDVLILSYYANDIQEACEASGSRLPGFAPYANLPPLAARLVRRSYLLDLLYWRFPQGDLSAYENALEACYASPRILAAHLADLEGFERYCRSRGIPLLVVAFPHLVRAGPTRRLIAPVILCFRDRAVPVLDVFALLERLPVPERIVSPNDPHPSVKVNGLVAEAAFSLLESQGLLRAARAR